jgi:predicted TIM-barrel fold metal-dependent hydrolase
MLIDAHNHPNFHGYGARRILENMDAQGIDRMWLLTWDSPRSEYDVFLNQAAFPPTAESGIPLEDVLSVASIAPERFVLGYAPHPKRPDAVERIKAAVELYGVRLAGEYKNRVLFDDHDSIRLLRAFGELRLPVTIHLEYPIAYTATLGGANYPWRHWWYGGTIEALERAVVACPETIIICHGPGWWAHISRDDLFDKEMYPKGPVLPGGKNPAMLARYPNLYADLSAGSGFNALTRSPDVGRQYLIDHADKLLFGRDGFESRLMDHLRTLALPESAMEKITHRNALRLVGEPGAGR